MRATTIIQAKHRNTGGSHCRRTTVGVLIMLAALGSLARGQVITGRIFGTVRDSSGSAVPAAKVIVTNQDTGATYKYVTDSAGVYSVPELPAGVYQVAVSATGFKTAQVSRVRVTLGAGTQVDVPLEVGMVSTSVQVTGLATNLQTTAASVTNSLSEFTIQNLPLPGRDLLTMALLTPTVVQRGSCPVSCVSGNDYLGTNIPTIAGGRGEAVSFTLGGLNINNRTFETPMEKPPLDSLSEFTVLANDYSAEYGVGDGQIIADQRSGTNTLHGSAYEYDQNTAFDSRRFLEPTTDVLHYNQFGASVGGPVRLPRYDGRDRTFFFFNYEGTRVPTATITDGLFPTSAMLSGNFSQVYNTDGTLDTIYDPLTTNLATGTRQPFALNQIPAGRVSSIAATLMAAYHVPTPTAYTLPFNYQSAVASNTTVDQYVGRFDLNEGSKDTFSTRYNLSNPGLLSGNMVAYATTTTKLRNQLAGQTWAHLFGPTLVNSFRFGYTRQLNVSQAPVAASDNLQKSAGFSNPIPYNTLPEILLNSASESPSYTEIPGIVAGGNGQIQEQFQFVDDLSWVKGKHLLKFGTDIRRRRWDTFGTIPSGSSGMQFTGVFTSQLSYQPTNVNAGPGGYVTVGETGSPIADMVLGQVDQEAYGLGNATFGFRDSGFSWYVQDSYHVSRRMTVNFGLRWDYMSPIGEKYGKESWLAVTSPPCPTSGGCLLTDGVYKGLKYDPIIDPFPGQDKIRNGGLSPQYHNFAPRLAIAYDVGHNTVVRAGGGTFYSVYEQYQLPEQITQAPFGTGYEILNTNTITTGSEYQLNSAWTPLPSTTQGYVVPGTVSLNPVPLTWNVTPRVYDASLAIQHQFSSNTTAEIGYAGKWGHDLADFAQINYCTVPPGQPCQYNSSGMPITIYPNFGDIFAQTTTGTSNYESVYLRFDRHFSDGLLLGAHYSYSATFSTGFDSVSNDIFEGGTDILGLDDPRLRNYKRAVMDVPSSFVAYGVYQLPFGKGKAFAGSVSRGVDEIIGGWQVSWVTDFESGMEGDLSSFGSAHFVSADAANQLKRLNFRKTGYYFDPSLITTESTPWPVPPNSFRDAGVNNWDISMLKAFHFTDRQKVELRADLFNAFNHAQFEEPESRAFEAGFGMFLLNMPSDEGVSLRPARKIQLGLRYSF